MNYQIEHIRTDDGRLTGDTVTFKQYHKVLIKVCADHLIWSVAMSKREAFIYQRGENILFDTVELN